MDKTDDRFRRKLQEQLDYIKTSCEAYDAGRRSEAVRIGTSLRVLLHDTKSSTSLLTHLSANRVPILSTFCTSVMLRSGPNDTVVSFEGLITFTMTGFAPFLGNSLSKIEMPADEWWQQAVIGIGPDITLSRKVLALTAADKDGGAHVDSELPPQYKKLIDGVWVSTRSGPLADHQLLYLRQMGYEALNSPQLCALSEQRTGNSPS